MMMDLLLNCGIFCCVDKAAGNYYQLSGIPISELKSEQAVQPLLKNIAKTYGGKSANSRALHPEARTPSAIVFVRSRMLYARAALNAKGGVRFGMRHIHVLNRYPDRENHEQTVHIMRYIFPRQFDLHNVFTSKVDSRETAMPFKDYTLREKEIQQKDSQEASMTGLDGEQITKRKSHLPKRLRGEAVALVDKLRKLNHKCSYIEMLRHYCPVEVSSPH
ncbi:hypothetical protein BCR34DRAFT_118881 [Clohesyomyces aquaticus]|uniref:Telomerase reverse transcriptase n=1 Tax=Clohesyomyces aquaticus TaxID=1231657 RepID=A0A1Y2A112_9PLEO|nr:hypothetical protein BCR34DRAFT_118881 [Clohesyomyces aquaticus]